MSNVEEPDLALADAKAAALLKEQQDRNVKDLAKIRLEKTAASDYSGGWWSDIQNWWELNTYTDSGSVQFIGTKPKKGDKSGIRSRQRIVNPPSQTEPTKKVVVEQMGPDGLPIETTVASGGVRDFDTSTAVGDIGYDYAWRRINGIAPGATEEDYSNLGLYAGPRQEDGKRPFNSNVFRPPGGGAGGTTLYKGGGLTNEFNQLARRKYDVGQTDGTDVRNELMLLSRVNGSALSLFKELKRTGFYPEGTEISNMALNNQGFGGQDETAMTKFLDFSNQNLKTWQSMMPVLAGLTSVSVGGGQRYRGPSTDEVAAFLQEASVTLTGDKLTKEILKKAIVQVQADSKASFASGTQATGTSLLAEKQVQKTNPNQAASYGLGNAMQIAFGALGGRGG